MTQRYGKWKDKIQSGKGDSMIGEEFAAVKYKETKCNNVLTLLHLKIVNNN